MSNKEKKEMNNKMRTMSHWLRIHGTTVMEEVNENESKNNDEESVQPENDRR